MGHPPIIIYMHVCQKGPWRIPFDMMMNAIKSSGLYNEIIEIRIGVGNDDGHIVDDVRFHDPKIKTVAHGPSGLYERITLSHMRNYSETDGCQYLYCHTKGLKHLDGGDIAMKDCVTDWINLLIHWNINHWRTATDHLMRHDTYGCEYTSNPTPHYSGNFWWANSHFIRTLPKEIGGDYCDPEFWVLRRDNVLMSNIFSSGLDGGAHYFNRFIKGIHY